MNEELALLARLNPCDPKEDPDEVYEDPDMGDMPALNEQSWESDPDDNYGGADAVEGVEFVHEEVPIEKLRMGASSADISRKRPHVNVTDWSPNKSSRGGAKPTLIVVHVTAGHNRPGVSDLTGLGSWFGRTSSQVSSHVCTDNEAHSARFVRDGDKAWHCANFNRMALGIEQIAPGNGTEITRQMYRETARWIALWSHEHGIPIRKATISGSGVRKAGVIRHSELGAAGGGHADPGRYDLDACLNLARFYRGSF